MTPIEVRRLLLMAQSCPVLIIAETDEQARQLRNHIFERTQTILPDFIAARTMQGEALHFKACNQMTITTANKWNGRKAFRPFEGKVFVTDSMQPEAYMPLLNIAQSPEKLMATLEQVMS